MKAVMALTGQAGAYCDSQLLTNFCGVYPKPNLTFSTCWAAFF
jgi:hypothetical protein